MARTLYFSHDFDARNDPKITSMRGTYKSAGYGYYWIIVEMMAGEEGHKLPLQEWLIDSIAMTAQCRSNSIKQFITDCIEKYKLFNSDGEYFWSETLIKRMKKYEDSIEQKIEAGRKGAANRWKNSTAIAPPKHRCSTVVAENGKLNKIKVNESIGYSSKDTLSKTSFDFDAFTTIYNSICSNLPKVALLTEKRKTAIHKFAKEFTIEQFKTICENCNKSDHHIGKNDRGWKADFDFLMRTDKAVQFLEGKVSKVKDTRKNAESLAYIQRQYGEHDFDHLYANFKEVPSVDLTEELEDEE